MACCLLAACNAFQPSVQDFIVGTYVREAESKYSKAFDTIRIQVYDESNKSYQVQNSTGYHRIKEGKLQPKQFKFKEMVMLYNESTRQLEDNRSAKQFSFSPEKNTLLFGSAEYQKIN